MSETLKFFRKKKQFKGPADILLDGTFINYMVSNKKNIHHMSQVLNKTKVKLFVTRCNTDEMDHVSKIQTLKQLKIRSISCAHHGKKSPADCIMSKVRDGNQNGYFVASGDSELVQLLKQEPMVPIITNDGRGMVLKQPSASQRSTADDYDDEGVRIGAERGRGPFIG